MGWNLPPGCTDKDIDDAAPQNEPDEELYQCDCCGEMFPVEELHFIRFDAPGNSSQSDTTICENCSNPNFAFSGSF